MTEPKPPLSRVRAGCAALVLAALSGAAATAQPPVGAPPPGAPPAAAPWQHRESGKLVFDNIPPPDAALVARLDRYRHSRQATFFDWLPDGAMLIGTRFGNTGQVHRVASPLGMREQLTFYGEPIGAARAAPRGGGLVFLEDRGGDENAQLYYRAPDGAVREITHGDFIHGNPVWAHDGRQVAFYGNDRDGVSYDVYVADVAAETAPRLVVGGKQDTWYPLDWSPDDARLLVWRYLSVSESYLYVADLATGALTPLDTSGRHLGIRAARFAPDGRGVYVLSDEGGEFLQLLLEDPLTHQTRRVTPQVSFDVEDFDASPDGRYLAYVLNEDGRDHLTVADTTTRSEVSPAGLPEGVISRLRFDQTGRLAFDAESPQSPADVYVYDPKSERLERWTRSEAGPVDPNSFVAPELIHYPTWDRFAGHQRMLSAYVYRPRSPGPSPVVISIHGGPESQYRPRWDPFVQFLVNELGYAVIAPNVRGSSGYGRSFLALDNGSLREDAVRDIGSLLVWIGAQPAFDRSRVAVMGTSYGGYMALAALIAYGDRLSGGIDVVGISNFVTFLRNTSAYRRDLRRAEYGDERDPKTREFLERISPLRNASRIKKPLLVVEGLNDPRVPASESEQLVWRVRSGGGDVWYLVATDEGHGFRKKANRDAYLETAASFLARLAR